MDRLARASEFEPVFSVEQIAEEPNRARKPKGDVPEWIAALETLAPTEPLPGFSAREWEVLIADGTHFLNCWGAEAHQLGWTELDLFGVHPAVPASRYDCMGLVPLIRGGEVVQIRGRTATIRSPGGGLLS